MNKFYLMMAVLLFFGSRLMGQVPVAHDRKKIENIHELARSYISTRNYVHTWEPFPSIIGNTVFSGKKTIQPILGQIEVVYFIASWCLPCQEAVNNFKKIQEKYEKLDVRFTYIFTHDVKKDIVGFLKAFNLSDGMLGNQQILKDFHNPPLPTVYISDRKGWLIARFERFNIEMIDKLEEKLKLLTAF